MTSKFFKFIEEVLKEKLYNKKAAFDLKHGNELTNSKIKQLINSVINTNVDFVVEHPTDLKNGDYSTNVAMILAKREGGNPRDLAQIIVQNLLKKNIKDIEKIEVAGPGFINFYLSKDFFKKTIEQILKAHKYYGKNKKLSGKKIIIDYTDPNLFKDFHIGHLMSNAIGETLARVFEWNGVFVTRINYASDVGLNIAKTIWGMRKNRPAFPHDTDSLNDKVKFLGDSYVLGAQKYENDEIAKSEIDNLNKKIYELFDDSRKNNDPELEIYYQKGRKWSLENFNEIYHTLGTKFDEFIFESQVLKIGEEMVRKNIPNIFEMSDGAVIYRGEKDGLHTRVFINSIGLPTYETKDIGLAFLKNKKYKFDKSIVVTASEQSQYFKVFLSALSKIDDGLAKKTRHISHGMMRFTEGKMSSRSGNVITGSSLIQKISDMVTDKISNRNFSQEETKKIKEEIAVGAIKYSILKQAPGKDIIFDPEKSVSFEGDSGPYLQYTFARANSVLKKSNFSKNFSEIFIPENWTTTNLERVLYRFPEVVEKAYLDFTPQDIVTYLTNLASEFNSFYTENQIIDGSNSEKYKLAITQSVAQVLQNGLTILAIKTPEKM